MVFNYQEGTIECKSTAYKSGGTVITAIPVEVRRVLDINPGDKLRWEIRIGESIRVVRVERIETVKPMYKED